MKILFLYNKSKGNIQDDSELSSSHFYGLRELKSLGFDASFTEIEHFFPPFLSRFLRKHINIHFIHLFIFPKILKSDVVITSTAYGMAFFRSLFKINKPKWFIIDFNLAYELSHRKGIKLYLLKKSINFTDGIVTLSEAESNLMKKIFPNKSVNFIRFGVNTDEFKLSQVNQEDFILSVGRDPGRDYTTLIKAVEGTNINLIITAKKSQLKDLLPLPKNVSVRDFTKKELIDVYNKAVCVVIPLNPKEESADSMGCSSLLEAMSMGKAVVVTDTLHMRSYVNNGKTGILVQKGDAEDMKSQLLKIIADKKLAFEIGNNARAWVIENATMNLFAKNLRNFVES